MVMMAVNDISMVVVVGRRLVPRQGTTAQLVGGSSLLLEFIISQQPLALKPPCGCCGDGKYDERPQYEGRGGSMGGSPPRHYSTTGEGGGGYRVCDLTL
jgi:hypothetical protein